MKKDIKLTEKYYSIQKKEWVAFRVFWIFMGLVVLAAFLGLFGSGYLSKKTHTTENIEIEYSKFLRVDKEDQLYITAKDLGKNAAIGINNDYIKKVRITQVVPEPASVEVNDQRLIYRFSNVSNGVVTFFLAPKKMGSQKLELTVAGERMSFDQYIYF